MAPPPLPTLLPAGPRLPQATAQVPWLSMRGTGSSHYPQDSDPSVPESLGWTNVCGDQGPSASVRCPLPREGPRIYAAFETHQLTSSLLGIPKPCRRFGGARPPHVPHSSTQDPVERMPTLKTTPRAPAPPLTKAWLAGRSQVTGKRSAPGSARPWAPAFPRAGP